MTGSWNNTTRIINRKFENVVVYFQLLSIFLKIDEKVAFIVKISSSHTVAQWQIEVMFLGKAATLSLTEFAGLVSSDLVLIKTGEISGASLLKFEIMIDRDLTSW